MSAYPEINEPLNKRQHDQSEYSQFASEAQKSVIQTNQKIQNKDACSATKVVEYDDSQKNLPPVQHKFDSMTTAAVWGYSVGHFYNDLCAAIWFNYLLFFLLEIQHLENIGPYAILSGQVFDAIATPIVGLLSDRTKNNKFGQRTPWYILGLILVTGCFLPIYLPLLPLNYNNDTVKGIYFIVFPSIFNVGWASVQIAHMALVPSLTCNRKKRDTLNGRRNTFTFIANLMILLLALLFFYLTTSVKSFMYLALVTVAVGISASIFFLTICREAGLVKDCAKYAKELKKILQVQVQTRNEIQNYSHDDEDFNKVLQQANQKEQGKHYQSGEASNKRKSINDLILESKKNTYDIEFSENGDDDDNNRQGKDNFRVSKQLNERDTLMAKVEQQNRQTKRQSEVDDAVHWRVWFSETLFYQCGIIYMSARLYVEKQYIYIQIFCFYIISTYCNVIATMTNFYLVNVLYFEISGNDDGQNQSDTTDATKTPIQVALVPLILYVSSVIFSSIIDWMFKIFGRKTTFAIGGISAIATQIALICESLQFQINFFFVNCKPHIFLNKKLRFLIYPIAAFIGGSQALILNTGITLISDVIGVRGSSGAFVFGTYSFLDKISSGVALFVIAKVPGLQLDNLDDRESFTRWITVIVPLVAVVLAWIFVVLQKTTDTNSKKKEGEIHRSTLERELAQ